MFYSSGCEWYMNELFCKMLQNTDRNVLKKRRKKKKNHQTYWKAFSALTRRWGPVEQLPPARPHSRDAVVYVKRPGCVFFYKLVRIMKRIFVLSLPIIASSQEEPVHCKQACRINTFWLCETIKSRWKLVQVMNFPPGSQ